MQRRLKIGVSLPIPPRRASVCLPACLPAGLLRDLEEGSRPGLLPKASGSAFVCLWALRGQEEAAGLGNNGSFSRRQRLASSDRGRGPPARRRHGLGRPEETVGGDARRAGGTWGAFPSPSLFPAVSLAPNQAPGWRGVGWSRVGAPSGGGDGGTNTQREVGACLQPALGQPLACP